jgi:DNA-binding transcriptional regulator YdaS (Cro superfamily)
MNAIDRAISICGGQSSMARAVGVSAQAISFWQRGARRPDVGSCIKIEQATGGGVRCEDLRDDIDWAYLRRPLPPSPSDQVAA